jgi:hypothetical protein
MRIAVMQPYFFPHIAYFQLISSVDIYVNLDHVSFMKRSFMVRNRIKNDTRINIEVIGASQNKAINQVHVGVSDIYIKKFIKTIEFNYSKYKNYEVIMHTILKPIFEFDSKTISQFNLDIIKTICYYLEIKTKIVDTSSGITDKKFDDGLIDIVKNMGGKTYINALGGVNLYNKEYFNRFDLNLMFLKSKVTDIEDSNVSILDILFSYDKELIQHQLSKYELI